MNQYIKLLIIISISITMGITYAILMSILKKRLTFPFIKLYFPNIKKMT